MPTEETGTKESDEIGLVEAVLEVREPDPLVTLVGRDVRGNAESIEDWVARRERQPRRHRSPAPEPVSHGGERGQIVTRGGDESVLLGGGRRSELRRKRTQRPPARLGGPASV